MTHHDPALTPPIVSIGKPLWSLNLPPIEFQGIPAIACSANGTVFATWYGGGKGEGPDNYVSLTHRDPTNDHWRQPWLFVHHPHPNVRTFDPAMWTDPQGRVWLFWCQGYSPAVNRIWDGRGGVWGICCQNPDTQPDQWSTPKRFCDGVMLNHPTLDEQSRWILPVSTWKMLPAHPDVPRHLCGPRAAIYDPETDTITNHPPADIPLAIYDEHHILPESTGRWGLYARTRNPNHLAMVCHSTDQGRSWSPAIEANIPCPNSRFYLGKLHSGAWLLISHDPAHFAINPKNQQPSRSHLTAWLSDDQGHTWPNSLLIDERTSVSYPDMAQSPDGRIHITYDHNRYIDGDILYVSFTEADIRHHNPHAATHQTINTGLPGKQAK